MLGLFFFTDSNGRQLPSPCEVQEGTQVKVEAMFTNLDGYDQDIGYIQVNVEDDSGNRVRCFYLYGFVCKIPNRSSTRFYTPLFTLPAGSYHIAYGWSERPAQLSECTSGSEIPEVTC